MKRNSSKRRLAIARIELMREATKLRNEVQYLFDKLNFLINHFVQDTNSS